MEKDEVEEELEKLVFGDDEGFKRGLQLEGRNGEELSEDDDAEGRGEIEGDGILESEIEGIDDADVRRETLIMTSGCQANIS